MERSGTKGRKEKGLTSTDGALSGNLVSSPELIQTQHKRQNCGGTHS